MEDRSPSIDGFMDRLHNNRQETLLSEATTIFEDLRNAREFDKLAAVAEEVTRSIPDSSLIRKYYAQSMIDTGKTFAAIDILTATMNRVDQNDCEYDELQGLLGRAYKQIYTDSVDPESDNAKQALREAIKAYQGPFKRDQKRNYWHGINLSALVHLARAQNMNDFPELDAKHIAKTVLDSLDSPEVKRGAWWSATKAEAHIARGEWNDAEIAIKTYVDDKTIPPFNFASTLRQLRDVWKIQDLSHEGLGLLQILEAELVSRENGVLDLSPTHIRTMRAADLPDPAQRERVLGTTSAQTIEWYRMGLARAASVAAIKLPFGKRVGTGFAVRATDIDESLPDEVLLLTNFHVVNRKGESDAERPEDVEVIFEAAGTGSVPLGPFQIREVVAESPFVAGLDYTLLRLEGNLEDIVTVPLTRSLPKSDSKTRVYIIGHPDAQQLHISLQDNYLLDHEGPPNGKPGNSARIRVHYRTPTSKGSSGSPVFDRSWRGIALHHIGGKYDPTQSLFGLRKLNGKQGRYSANEGFWIYSIIEDILRSKSSE